MSKFFTEGKPNSISGLIPSGWALPKLPWHFFKHVVSPRRRIILILLFIRLIRGSSDGRESCQVVGIFVMGIKDWNFVPSVFNQCTLFEYNILPFSGVLCWFDVFLCDVYECIIWSRTSWRPFRGWWICSQDYESEFVTSLQQNSSHLNVQDRCQHSCRHQI